MSSTETGITAVPTIKEVNKGYLSKTELKVFIGLLQVAAMCHGNHKFLEELQAWQGLWEKWNLLLDQQTYFGKKWQVLEVHKPFFRSEREAVIFKAKEKWEKKGLSLSKILMR